MAWPVRPRIRRTPWTVPASARTPPPPPGIPVAPAATAALAADSATTAVVQFSLADVVDLALKSNPATRESWANAQVAANQFGSARGALFPTINGSLNLAGASTGSAFGGGGNGNSIVIDTWGIDAGGGCGGRPDARAAHAGDLTAYLVLDAGGRKAAIEAAKQNAIAMNLAHNTAINDLVLAVEWHYFTYLANVALRDAQITAVKEAQTDTAAAEARLRVGVGTLQDVLQERGPSSRKLAFSSWDAPGHTAHLARDARRRDGFARQRPLRDSHRIAANDSVAKIAASVDTLINRAVTLRPDLAQAHAAAAQPGAQIRVAQSGVSPRRSRSRRSRATRNRSKAPPRPTASTPRSCSGCRSRSSTDTHRGTTSARPAPSTRPGWLAWHPRNSRSPSRCSRRHDVADGRVNAWPPPPSCSPRRGNRPTSPRGATTRAWGRSSTSSSRDRRWTRRGPGTSKPDGAGAWPCRSWRMTSARSTFGDVRTFRLSGCRGIHERAAPATRGQMERRRHGGVRRGVMQRGAAGAQDAADAGACHDHLTHRRSRYGRGQRRRRADADGVGDGAGEWHAARRAVRGRRLRHERTASLRIDPRPLQALVDQARATLTKDQATAAAAARDDERFKSLANVGYVSRSAADSQHATALAAAATVQADQANLRAAEVNLGFTSITAPISGARGA